MNQQLEIVSERIEAVQIEVDELLDGQRIAGGADEAMEEENGEVNGTGH